MDKFEQFFKENRLRLDTEDLDESLWNNIQNSFASKKRVNVYRSLYLVASLTLIIGLSIVLFYSKNDNISIEKPIFSEIDEVLSQEEISFIHLVNSQVEIIENSKIQSENLALLDGFIYQLKTIDKQHDLCRENIEKQGYTNELIQQVIYIYQLKLSVLGMMQTEINKINQHTNIQDYEKENVRIY